MGIECSFPSPKQGNFLMSDVMQLFYKTSPKSTACDNKKEPLPPGEPTPGGGSRSGKSRKKPVKRKLLYMLE
jgi:hypothetical protein